MADHRTSFRPRRLAFGGRLFPRGCILGASLALLIPLAPVLAEDAGLKNGAASLSAGKYDNAVRQLSATVNSDTASPGEAAKAMYLRGIAYRKLNQPARAIADLGAALWLGLPGADKVKALVNRGLAYQAAGLSKEAQAEFASARKAGSSSDVDKLIAEDGGGAGSTAAIAAFATEVKQNEGAASPPPPRTADASTPWATPTGDPGARPAPAPKPASGAAAGSWDTSVSGDTSASSSEGNRLTRWFGSLTSPSESSSDTAAPAPQAPSSASTPPSSGSWATQTKTQTADAGPPSAGGAGASWTTNTAEAPAAPKASSGGGSYRLQLAASSSEAEARQLWQKVSSQHQQLAGTQPQIDKTEVGNFGTFYRLQIGPFTDKAESLKLCNALKRSGVDCFLVTPEP
jgi:cell division septation protein DedD